MYIAETTGGGGQTMLSLGRGSVTMATMRSHDAVAHLIRLGLIFISSYELNSNLEKRTN